MNSLHNKLKQNIYAEYFYGFINNLNMANSIWVLYLAYRGMNLLQIGLLEGVYHLTGLLFEIPSGAVADLLGRKKTLLSGRILMVISCIIMLFANSFAGFALGFFFQALSGNFNSGSEEAMLYDSMKCIGREEDYLTVSGRLNTLYEVAQGIATVAGGILAEYSYTYCYIACIVIALLGLLPTLCMTEPPIHAEDASEEPTKRTIADTIANHFQTSSSILKEDKTLLHLILYYSVVFAAYTLLFFYSQQYFSDLGLNKIEISVIMLFAGIVACLGALFSERLSSLLGKKATLLGACAIALSVLSFGLHHLYVAIGALLVATFCNSLLYPIQSNALNQRIPSAQRATLISVNSMFFSVFMILFFPMVGAVADRIGLAHAFCGIGAIVLLIALGAHKSIES